MVGPRKTSLRGTVYAVVDLDMQSSVAAIVDCPMIVASCCVLKFSRRRILLQYVSAWDQP